MEGAPEPLIGREAELRALIEAIDVDRPVVVEGEAGIGKTSLVRAAARIGQRRVHEGGGFATLSWMPYLALRRALGVGLSGDAASVAMQVERLVGPDLLFIDDLQWVDEDTLAALELSIGRILVVVAVRAGDPGSTRAVDMAAAAGATTLRLTGLADDAAAAIVRRVRPGLSEPLTGGIVGRAGGNPLLLEELAAGGEASTVLERALTSRLDLLSPAARHVAELVAVAERPIPSRAAGAGLDEAVEAGVVVRHGGEVEIRHVLVGEAIRSRLAENVARRLHDELAAALSSPLERARHLAAAGRRDEAARLAMAALETVSDPRDRAALLVLAAEASPASAGSAMRLRAARALDEVSEWPAIVRTLAASGDDGTPEELVERDAILAHASYVLGDPGASRARLDAAAGVEVAPGADAAVRLAIERATFLINVDGALERAIATLDAARVGQADGSPGARDLDVLRGSILLLATGAGDGATISVAADEAFAAGRYRTAADRARVMHYLLLMGSTAESALAFLLAQRARFDAAAVGSVALEFLADAVVAAVLAGRLGEAVALADELAELPAPPRARQTAEIARGRALVHLGEFDQAAATLSAVGAWASPDFFGRGEALAGQAELAFWSGRATTAVGLVDLALAIPAPIPVAHVQALLVRAWARTELGLDPGDPIRIPLTPSLAGAALEIEGLRGWHAGETRVAAGAFEAAAAQWDSFHLPHALLCRWAAAESIRRGGDLAAAANRLAAVLEAATQGGFEALATRIRRSLRLAGVRTSGAARTQALAAGGLTAREQELVTLVERGLTNVEIARRLGLGRPTVARILASAMTKLGVSSRAQLAAIAPA